RRAQAVSASPRPSRGARISPSRGSRSRGGCGGRCHGGAGSRRAGAARRAQSLPDPHPFPPPLAGKGTEARLLNPMPEQDPSSSSEAAGPAPETRNLPVPIPQSSLVAHERPEGWLVWALRILFGWKAGSIRANLTDVLKAGAG